jgi:hypothetical protein
VDGIHQHRLSKPETLGGSGPAARRMLSFHRRELDARVDLYEQAIKEAEAILGGEYDMHYGKFFDLVEKARSTLTKSEGLT